MDRPTEDIGVCQELARGVHGDWYMKVIARVVLYLLHLAERG